MVTRRVASAAVVHGSIMSKQSGIEFKSRRQWCTMSKQSGSCLLGPATYPAMASLVMDLLKRSMYPGNQGLTLVHVSAQALFDTNYNLNTP